MTMYLSILKSMNENHTDVHCMTRFFILRSKNKILRHLIYKESSIVTGSDLYVYQTMNPPYL